MQPADPGHHPDHCLFGAGQAEEQVFSCIGFDQCLRERRRLKAWVEKLHGTNISVEVAPVPCREACLGAFALLELAHRGILFLDEVEGMSPILQVKLLRVLQEQEIMRVGGGRVISIDVRITVALYQFLEVSFFANALMLLFLFALYRFATPGSEAVPIDKKVL